MNSDLAFSINLVSGVMLIRRLTKGASGFPASGKSHLILKPACWCALQ